MTAVGADLLDAWALGRYADGLGAWAAVICADEVVPLADLLPQAPTVEAVLADWAAHADSLEGAVRAARSSGRWAALARPAAALRPLAPYVPGQVFQSGANYRTHVVQLMTAAAPAAERATAERAALALMAERADSGTPYVFLGLASAVCGPHDDVVLPPTGVQHDWELELAAVIGAHAWRVDPGTALEAVAAYTIVNDITTRDRVFRPDLPAIGTDWLAAKNAPTFLPLGPWLVPARFVPDPLALRITLALDGDVMQDESTADMLFDVAQLVSHVSAVTPLRPGDLVLTGSPAGNGAHHGRFLRPGDVMRVHPGALAQPRQRALPLVAARRRGRADGGGARHHPLHHPVRRRPRLSAPQAAPPRQATTRPSAARTAVGSH